MRMPDLTVPVGEHGQLVLVDLAVKLRDEGEVDARIELDRWWFVWVIIAAEW